MRTGVLFGHPVGLLRTGVGKANAAASTAVLLSKMPVRVAINFGCGGAFPDAGLEVGDLALASEEVFGDEGALTPSGFFDMERLGFPLHCEGEQKYFNRVPLDAALADRSWPVLKALSEGKRLRVGRGPFVTVSCCSGTESAGRELARRTDGICENMEGAAVIQVCRRFGVPALEVRGISNLTLDRDPSTWNLGDAVEIAQAAVLELLQNWDTVGSSR